MRHFSQLSSAERARLFHVEPHTFDLNSDRRVLATALGATLYAPSIRPELSRDISRMGQRGVTSMVVCLEDSIGDHQVAEGEANLVSAVKAQFIERESSDSQYPLLFVRVRAPEQIIDLVDRWGESSAVIAGFVLPKFCGEAAEAYMEAISRASMMAGRTFLAMPILESPELIFHESRYETLVDIQRIVRANDASILALRIGATDLSGAFGLRRSPEFTIYDIRVIAETISAIVNIFGRHPEGHVITGPVWEYFGQHERIFRPQLRQTPFVENDATSLRSQMLAGDLDGLLKEVSLDHANGLMGKTVIHPSHVTPVHALSVVTLEEWTDASSTQQKAGEGGGVLGSQYKDKMNEAKPHQGWAERVHARAAVFGVAREETTFVDLLASGSS